MRNGTMRICVETAEERLARTARASRTRRKAIEAAALRLALTGSAEPRPVTLYRLRSAAELVAAGETRPVEMPPDEGEATDAGEPLGAGASEPGAEADVAA
jgi:hypothetical protein